MRILSEYPIVNTWSHYIIKNRQIVFETIQLLLPHLKRTGMGIVHLYQEEELLETTVKT